MAEAWAKYKIRLRAEIGGQSYLDVVQWTATWELNNIPHGQLLLAVGRNFSTQQAATIHRTVDTLKTKMKAKVFLEVIPSGAAAGIVNEWPKGEFVVFDGYAVATGWRRSREEAQFVVHLLHWLDDLHGSSMLSATSHPSNPSDFTFGAVFPALGLNSSGGEDPAATEPAWTATCDATRSITNAVLEDDLWGAVLLPWLQTIASQDRLDVNPLGGAGISRGLNDRAKLALARMGQSDRGSCDVVKLAMDIGGADGNAIANGVRNYLTRETFSSWVHTTFWGKLVGEWGPQFMFSIVPRIEDAFPVPFTGPLRTPFKTILPSEYDFADVGSAMPQVLQAVGIFHPVQMYTGGDGGAAGFPKSYAQLCGWYSPEDEPEGLLLMKDPPGWITEIIPEIEQSRDSSGAEGDAIGTAAEPDVGKDIKGDDPAKAVGGVAQTTFMNRFAQQWYALESTKGRQGEMSGKLRFDLAPGSNVKIIPAKEKFIGDDDLSLPRFATITRVTCMINAESKVAGTGFGLAHVRTAAENTTDKTSVERPPLYKEGWPGCSLSSQF